MSLFGRVLRSVLPYAKAPREDLAGPVPNSFQLGNITVEQVRTFSALLNTFSKTYDYRYDEAVKDDPEFAKKLQRDAFIQSLLRERFLPLMRWEWSLVPEDPEHKQQAERAKWYEAVVKAQPHLSKKLLYLGKGAGWYGRYAAQNSFVQDTVEGESCYRVGRHKPVNGDKLVFSYTNDDCPGIRINPMFAHEYPREDVTYDNYGSAVLLLRKPEFRKKFVLHVHEFDDPDYYEPEMAGRIEGIGLRDFVFYGGKIRNNLMNWALSYMNKIGTLGLLIFRYPQGNAQAKQAAEQAAREASNRNALAIPVPLGKDGVMSQPQAELLPANMTGVNFLVDVITRWFERHVERLFVGQSMSAGADESNGLGGTGRADFAKDTKFNLLAFDAVGLEETLTHEEIGPLCEINGDAGWKLRWKFHLPDPDADKKLEAVTKVSAMGVEFKKSEVRDLTGMSEPGPDDEVVGGVQPGMEGEPGGGDGGGSSAPEESEGDDGDVFSSLFGGGEDTAQYAAADWTQHTIASGPRKGRSAWKNTKTGEVSDTPPKDRRPGQGEANSGGKAKGPAKDSGVHADAQKHVRTLLSRAGDLPREIKDKATAFIANKYDQLSKRYGPTGAKAVLAGMVLLTPIPLPGTSLLPVALAEGVRLVAGAVKGSGQTAAGGDKTGKAAQPGVHGTIEALATQAGIPASELSHEATHLLHEATESEKKKTRIDLEELTKESAGYLVGAGRDAKIFLRKGPTGCMIDVESPEYSAGYAFEENDGEWTAYIDFMEVKKTGVGTGAKVFAKFLERCQAQGVSEIKLEAARQEAAGDHPGMNGHYTWPRFGFDRKLTGTTLKETREVAPGAKSVLDVMATPEGRQWWKENGTTLEAAAFDLTPGSRSMKIWSAYQKALTSTSAPSKKPPSTKPGKPLTGSEKKQASEPLTEADFAPTEQYHKAVSRAIDKFRDAPKPSKEEVKANKDGMALKGANKYRRDLVGNSKDRAGRREKLLAEFGDGKTCPCIYCGLKIGETEGSLEQDKIYTTGEGGRYRMPNLVPSCSDCNKVRGDKPFSDMVEGLRAKLKSAE